MLEGKEINFWKNVFIKTLSQPFTAKIIGFVVRFCCILEVFQPRPRGYKTFFMLNSAEHEIYPAHKC